MNTRLITIGAILFVMSAGCSFAGDKQFDKTLSAAAGGKLVVDTDLGSVEVEGTGGSQVIVHADIHGRRSDVEDFEITAEKTDNGVEVRGRAPRGSSWWHSNDLDVRFTIKVPHEYAVNLKTAGGDLRIAKLKGHMEGETSGGDLVLNDLEGSIDLGTSGGNIRATKVLGDLMAETSGGNVEIDQVKGNVDVSTSGGSIGLSSIEGKVSAETSGGDVTVQVSKENKGIHTETSGGNISITVPGDIAATIDASTSGGSVYCDLPITMTGRIDESRVRGNVNGGGNIIHAHTSGGNVRIRSK
jgi:DUF4097 and DUF4098 domain-containing protein YvlB